LEPPFLERLAKAKGNLPQYPDGVWIYENWVRPAVVTLLRVGAHYAISSAFKGYEQHDAIYGYRVDRKEHATEQAGHARLAVGRAVLCSRVTLEQADISFGVLHFGDHNVHAGVAQFAGPEAYCKVAQKLVDAFGRGDMAGVLLGIDQHYEGSSYSLKSLFRDEQRRILRQIMGEVLGDAEASYRGIYESHVPLMRFLADVRMPLPGVLRRTAEFVLNSTLRREFKAEKLDLERIAMLVENAQLDGVELDRTGLAYAFQKRLNRMMETVTGAPLDLEKLREMEAAIARARSLAFDNDLWRVQNQYWQLLQTVYPDVAAHLGIAAQDWITHFVALGRHLGIKVEQPAEMPLAA
jgi:hypothetical protein